MHIARISDLFRRFCLVEIFFNHNFLQKYKSRNKICVSQTDVQTFPRNSFYLINWVVYISYFFTPCEIYNTLFNFEEKRRNFIDFSNSLRQYIIWVTKINTLDTFFHYKYLLKCIAITYVEIANCTFSSIFFVYANEFRNAIVSAEK